MVNDMKFFISVIVVFLCSAVAFGGCANNSTDAGVTQLSTEAASYDFGQYQPLLPDETEKESTGTTTEKTTAETKTSTTENKTTRKLTATKPLTTRITTTAKKATTNQKATTTKKVTTTQNITTTKKVTTTKPTTTQAAVKKDYAVIIGMRSVFFGLSKQAITDAFGQPTETLTEISPSGDTYESLVYADNYSELAVFQLKNGVFGGFYTMVRSTIITDGEATYTLRSGGSTSFGDMQITLFEDTVSGSGAYALWAKYDGFSYRPETFSEVSGQERLIFHLTNSIRAANGVSPLQYSDKASTSARLHSEDMVKRNYFAHESPEGTKASQRMTAQGIPWTTCGENIASGFDSPFHFIEAWYNSSGHRENLIDKDYAYLGVGIASKDGSSHYATQNFYG